MDPRAFFSDPSCTAQRHYEALRAFYHEGLPATEAAQKFGLSPAYFQISRNRCQTASHFGQFEHGSPS